MANIGKRNARRPVPPTEQPYQIPDNWRWVSIGAVADLYTGNSINEKVKKQKYEGNPEGYLYIATKDIGFDGVINYETNIRIPAGASFKVAPPDTALLCIEGGSAGRKIGFVNQAVCFVNKLCAFRTATIHSKYVFYFLQTHCFEMQFLSKKRGLIGGVPIRELSLSIIPIAPIQEQKRIVERVESLFSKLDEVREKLQAALDGLELYKTALLRKAFAGELTRTWRKEHPDAGAWDNRALKDCGDWSGGGTPSMARPEYWENGDLLWITPKDMKADLIETSLLRVNALGAENSSAKRIEKPSVLFVTRSGILRRTLPVALVKVPFTVNQDLKVLSPYDDVDIEYLFWACKNYEASILRKCMKDGTTVESVNTKALTAFEIPIAPLAEQRVIAAYIKRCLTIQRETKETAERVMEQLDMMKKVILGRAFRGELGTNRPEEPPVSPGAAEKG